MIDEELLKILRCPETKQPLQVMTEDALKQLNERIAAGEMTTAGGDAVEKPLEAGLVTEDGSRVYRIEDEIPILLIEEAIPLSASS